MNKVKDSFKYLGHYGGHIYGVKKNGKDGNTSWEGEPIQKLTKENQFSAYKHTGFYQPMDTLRDKLYLEELWNSNKIPWKIWN